MSTDDALLQQACEQMDRMVRALMALHTEVLPKSRQQFALMAEGPLEEIRRLEETISAYVNQTLDALDDAVSVGAAA